MEVWNFLTSEENRAILQWLGGGLMIASAAIWTAIKFFWKPKAAKPKSAAPTSPISANRGIAAGGNVSIDQSRGMGGWQVIVLVLGIVGLVVLAASFSGNTVTATNGSIAVGGNVEGGVSQTGSDQ